TEVQVGWLRAGQPPALPARPGLMHQPVGVRWINGIVLQALQQPGWTVTAGAELPIRLIWLSEQAPQADLTFFIHLIDQEGNTVAQQDRRPFDGLFPTPVWQPGEQLQDEFIIMTPATLAAGNYQLRVGFYSAEGRLPLADGKADFATLSQIDPIQIRR
ncbi:MAG: hypothetical protein ACUVR3_12605, partial [Candidatus Roseilinea sp.]